MSFSEIKEELSSLIDQANKGQAELIMRIARDLVAEEGKA